jgi:hypothetical protein
LLFLEKSFVDLNGDLIFFNPVEITAYGGHYPHLSHLGPALSL